METVQTYVAFAGDRLVASGERPEMLRDAKRYLDAGKGRAVLIFEDWTGRQVDFDFRGSADDVVARAAPEPASAARSGPGRPKLGVVSREVSLLPRHWDWLGQQPQGISAALRRLVDDARKREPDESRASAARDAAGRFMWTMAGNRPGFEEASRALYAGDLGRLKRLMRGWPADVRRHVSNLLRVPPAK